MEFLIYKFTQEWKYLQFPQKNHKLEAYFLTIFQYTNNSWITINISSTHTVVGTYDTCVVISWAKFNAF